MSVNIASTQHFPSSVPVAGQDPGERVCHRCHPGHTDELHSLCVFLGHHCPESWIQAFLWQEGQFRFWWGKVLKVISVMVVSLFFMLFFYYYYYLVLCLGLQTETPGTTWLLQYIAELSVLVCFSVGLETCWSWGGYSPSITVSDWFSSQTSWQWVKQLTNHRRKRATPLILPATLPWKPPTSTITSPSSVWGW